MAARQRITGEQLQAMCAEEKDRYLARFLTEYAAHEKRRQEQDRYTAIELQRLQVVAREREQRFKAQQNAMDRLHGEIDRARHQAVLEKQRSTDTQRLNNERAYQPTLAQDTGTRGGKLDINQVIHARITTPVIHDNSNITDSTVCFDETTSQSRTEQGTRGGTLGVARYQRARLTSPRDSQNDDKSAEPRISAQPTPS